MINITKTMEEAIVLVNDALEAVQQKDFLASSLALASIAKSLIVLTAVVSDSLHPNATVTLDDHTPVSVLKAIHEGGLHAGTFWECELFPCNQHLDEEAQQ